MVVSNRTLGLVLFSGHLLTNAFEYATADANDKQSPFPVPSLSDTQLQGRITKFLKSHAVLPVLAAAGAGAFAYRMNPRIGRSIFAASTVGVLATIDMASWEYRRNTFAPTKGYVVTPAGTIEYVERSRTDRELLLSSAHQWLLPSVLVLAVPSTLWPIVGWKVIWHIALLLERTTEDTQGKWSEARAYRRLVQQEGYDAAFAYWKQKHSWVYDGRTMFDETIRLKADANSHKR